MVKNPPKPDAVMQTLPYKEADKQTAREQANFRFPARLERI